MNKLNKILAQSKDIHYRSVDTDKAWDKFRAKANIVQEPIKNTKVIPLVPKQWLSIAAGLVLLLTATFIFWPEAPKFETTMASVESSVIKMIDGSVINLDKNSEVTYPVNYDGLDERYIVLTGNATFDVAHNPNMPFRVLKDDLLIEVLGTEFTLTGGDNGNIEVENHEGSVRASDVNDPTITIVLLKGDKVNFTPEGFVDLNYVAPVIPEPIIDHTATYSLYEIYFHLYERSNGAIDLHPNAKIDGRSTVRMDLTQNLQVIIDSLDEKTNFEYNYAQQVDMILIKKLLEK